MATEPKSPPVIDPDNVEEILCDGRFYLHPHGNLATLTFTQSRPRPADLFDGRIVNDEVVRARITMTVANVAALRDLLVSIVKSGTAPPEAGGSTKH